MRVRIEKGAPVGDVEAPPSKSYGHRMLICAALAAPAGCQWAGCQVPLREIKKCKEFLTVPDTIISGFGSDEDVSEDILATIDCIRALGIRCDIAAGKAAVGTGDARPSGLPVFPCRESGSTLRFFIPIAMVLAGGGMFTGSERLMQRGIEVYEELFAAQSSRPGSSRIRIERSTGSIVIKGRLTAGEMTVRGDVSSQFISGLLFALPLLDGSSTLHVTGPIESRLYIDITIDAMRQFGVNVSEPEAGTFHISGGQRYIAGDKAIEGDWSNAAFLYAMKYLHEDAGRDLSIRGLNPQSLQGDKICIAYMKELDEIARSSIDLSGCPDLGPVLFAYAAARTGGRFTGVRRLRIKESDRIACMQEELEKFGIKTHSGNDELAVYPGTLHEPDVILDGHNDHRIVMALAVLCTLTGGTIDGAQAVRKSWPGFFDTLRHLGVTVHTDV